MWTMNDKQMMEPAYKLTYVPDGSIELITEG